jgi:MATE family multidrug resistance protein
VSQAVGARDEPGVARSLQRGVIIALALSVLGGAAMVPVGPVLTAASQPAEVIPTASRFVWVMIPSLLPYFLYVVFRQTLQALHHLRSIVISVVAANLLNAALNWVFVYGHLGSPALGAYGSAISTTIGRFVMLAILVVDARRHLLPRLRPWRAESMQLEPFVRMLRLGVPIGLQTLLEVAAFGTALLLVGLLGTIPLAGHEVTITLAALTFMVPLGTAGAAAVLVGRAIGRGDEDGARREASAALACGVAFMSCTALTFLTAPHFLAGLFTRDTAVLAVAVLLIPIAGVFQVFDGVQVVAAGVLRGVGDTRVPMLINFVGYFVLGLPIGAWLTFGAGLGAQGMWWGLVAGLVAVSSALAARVQRRLGGPLHRLVIDHAPTSAH